MWLALLVRVVADVLRCAVAARPAALLKVTIFDGDDAGVRVVAVGECHVKTVAGWRLSWIGEHDLGWIGMA